MVSRENRVYWLVYVPVTLVLLYGSFLLRWYWPQLHDLFLAYPSDVWYIHYNYGWFLVNQGYFRMEYQAPLWAFVKILSLICSAIFPATEMRPQGPQGIYNFQAWMLVNAAALTPFALALSWCMHRLDVEFYRVGRWRVLFGFILTPTFLYFSLFNWDLIPMLCCVAGLLSLLRDQEQEAFLYLGMGASFKTYPGLLAVPFWLWLPRDRRMGAFLAFCLPVFVFNVPFLVRSPSTWWFPYQWQGNFDATAQPGRPLYHLTVLLHTAWPSRLLVGAACLYTLYQWRKQPQERRDTPQELAIVSLFLMIGFLMAKNIFSPQYIFWLMPFMALVSRYPWWGLGTTMEVMNILEPFRLDYWRAEQHPENMIGLKAIRLVRDIFLIGYWISLYLRVYRDSPSSETERKPTASRRRK